MTAEYTPGNSNACFRCPARIYKIDLQSGTCDITKLNGSKPNNCPQNSIQIELKTQQILKKQVKGYDTADPHELLKQRLKSKNQ